MPSADPDADGLPNAVEAYFGQSPTQSSALPKPVVLWSNSELVLQWMAASDTRGATATPEWSDDLTTWRADVPGGGANLPLTNLGAGDQPNTTRWEARVATAGAPVRFLRLAIQVP